jgi:hypothetical protein
VLVMSAEPQDRKRDAGTIPALAGGRRPIATPIPAMPSTDPSPAARAPTPPDLGPDATEPFLALLRRAEALLANLGAQSPAAATLVRATVYRAIHEHHEAHPDATAHLYRCSGVGGGAGEPPLAVLQRLLGAHAQVAPEKPLAVEPFTSAAQAKEHIGRLLGEIERCPNEPALRHFLALGVLTELLVRAKLPPQVEQRLRDIVAHAQREGARGPAIDLMMTALQRIASG